MKLDMSLVRLILLEVERQDEGGPSTFELSIPGHSDSAVSYHVGALNEAGLVEAYSVPPIDPDAPDCWEPKHLTWAGHQYLASVRDEAVWRMTLEKTAKLAGGVTLEIFKATATSVARTLLGLPAG